jgi:hypothetical protein
MVAIVKNAKPTAAIDLYIKSSAIAACGVRALIHGRARNGQCENRHRATHLHPTGARPGRPGPARRRENSSAQNFPNGLA